MTSVTTRATSASSGSGRKKGRQPKPSGALAKVEGAPKNKTAQLAEPEIEGDDEESGPLKEFSNCAMKIDNRDIVLIGLCILRRLQSSSWQG
jgi:hypothetical protein